MNIASSRTAPSFRRTCTVIVMAVALVISGANADEVPEGPFEDHVIEMTFSNEGVAQTEQHSPLVDRMQAYQSAGVCVTLVEDNEIAWTRGSGVQSIDTGVPIDPESVFQAGSACKFVTALIVLHYVEEGVLDLDTDINSYLTSWAMPANDYDKTITLRHLLSHQSGLPGTNFGQEPDTDLPTLPQILNAESPAINKPAIPEFEPGLQWSYSNIGYVVIQLVLEDVLDREFADIANGVVFKPLHMDSSTFRYPLPDQLGEREAMPHDAEGIAHEAAQDSRARAQGGLLTTTADMALLVIEVMKSLAGESEVIISRDMALQMTEGEVEIPFGAFGIAFDMGLGVFIEGDARSFLHPGQSYPGSAFLFVAFPETGQAVVIAVNSARGEQLQLEILATLAQDFELPGGQYFR
jgi:CubicO group peptidase (beta-lactamase class C family)